MFQKESGNWTDYREKFGLEKEDEIDLHFGRRDDRQMTYDDVMAQVEELVKNTLREAQNKGREYVMFCHGWSTSEGWKKTTARSVVRGFMCSKTATPLIVRKCCIQHDSVFVARVRPKPTE